MSSNLALLIAGTLAIAERRTRCATFPWDRKSKKKKKSLRALRRGCGAGCSRISEPEHYSQICVTAVLAKSTTPAGTAACKSLVLSYQSANGFDTDRTEPCYQLLGRGEQILATFLLLSIAIHMIHFITTWPMVKNLAQDNTTGVPSVSSNQQLCFTCKGSWQHVKQNDPVDCCNTCHSTGNHIDDSKWH